MRCLKCKGDEFETSECGLKCVNCKKEFFLLNGELRPLDENTKTKEPPILTSVDCCPGCGNEEIVGGEIIAEDGKNYRVYRCGCGAEVKELLVDQREYEQYCEETARELIAEELLLAGETYPL